MFLFAGAVTRLLVVPVPVGVFLVVRFTFEREVVFEVVAVFVVDRRRDVTVEVFESVADSLPARETLRREARLSVLEGVDLSVVPSPDETERGTDTPFVTPARRSCRRDRTTSRS